MTSRRGFFGKIAGLFGAAAVAPILATPAPFLFPPGDYSLRVLRSADVSGMNRIDILYGFGALYPEFACRIITDEPPQKIQFRFDPARLPA